MIILQQVLKHIVQKGHQVQTVNATFGRLAFGTILRDKIDHLLLDLGAGEFALSAHLSETGFTVLFSAPLPHVL